VGPHGCPVRAAAEAPRAGRKPLHCGGSKPADVAIEASTATSEAVPQGAAVATKVVPLAERELQPKALFAVRADIVDRLVNEAGEVAIARSRIEGEMRAVKAAMQELTDNVLRLRAQLREIEIQAESQMQSRRNSPRSPCVSSTRSSSIDSRASRK